MYSLSLSLYIYCFEVYCYDAVSDGGLSNTGKYKVRVVCQKTYSTYHLQEPRPFRTPPCLLPLLYLHHTNCSSGDAFWYH